MPLLVLRGNAALVALRNSAMALRDDAFTLIRSTKPDSHERISGTSSGHTPRSTGKIHPGLRGVSEMGRDHEQWVAWKIGIIGLIEREPMQRAVEKYIDAVIDAGLALINASVSAKSTMHSPWADHYSDLNDAINNLPQAAVHVPPDPAPLPARVLLMLVRRLIDQNGKVGSPHDDGSVDARGYPDSMKAKISKHTWAKEMEERGDHHAFWLDRTTAETQRTTSSQRAMASLFELSIAVQMLEKGSASAVVIEALQVVCDQPYWNVETTEQWEERAGRKADMVVRFPLMAVERPIGSNALDRLDQVARQYSETVSKKTRSSSRATSSGTGKRRTKRVPTEPSDFKPAVWFGKKIAARLRMATGPKRKSKRVRWKWIDGVKCYSVSDAQRWWKDVPAK